MALSLLPEGYPLFDWTTGNGEATAEQTQKAYTALNERGYVSAFHGTVWNDMVSCLHDAIVGAGFAWNNQFGTAEETKITDTDRTLTARRFNAMRYNIDYLWTNDWTWSYPEKPSWSDHLNGYLGRDDVRGYSEYGEECDRVYGWYLLELAAMVNYIIRAWRGEDIVRHMTDDTSVAPVSADGLDTSFVGDLKNHFLMHYLGISGAEGADAADLLHNLPTRLSGISGAEVAAGADLRETDALSTGGATGAEGADSADLIREDRICTAGLTGTQSAPSEGIQRRSQIVPTTVNAMERYVGKVIQELHTLVMYRTADANSCETEDGTSNRFTAVSSWNKLRHAAGTKLHHSGLQAVQVLNGLNEVVMETILGKHGIASETETDLLDAEGDSLDGRRVIPMRTAVNMIADWIYGIHAHAGQNIAGSADGAAAAGKPIARDASIVQQSPNELTDGDGQSITRQTDVSTGTAGDGTTSDALSVDAWAALPVTAQGAVGNAGTEELRRRSAIPIFLRQSTSAGTVEPVNAISLLAVIQAAQMARAETECLTSAAAPGIIQDSVASSAAGLTLEETAAYIAVIPEAVADAVQGQTETSRRHIPVLRYALTTPSGSTDVMSHSKSVVMTDSGVTDSIVRAATAKRQVVANPDTALEAIGKQKVPQIASDRNPVLQAATSMRGRKSADLPSHRASVVQITKKSMRCWLMPIWRDGALYIRQAYEVSQKDNILEVK